MSFAVSMNEALKSQEIKNSTLVTRYSLKYEHFTPPTLRPDPNSPDLSCSGPDFPPESPDLALTPLNPLNLALTPLDIQPGPDPSPPETPLTRL